MFNDPLFLAVMIADGRFDPQRAAAPWLATPNSRHTPLRRLDVADLQRPAPEPRPSLRDVLEGLREWRATPNSRRTWFRRLDVAALRRPGRDPRPSGRDELEGLRDPQLDLEATTTARPDPDSDQVFVEMPQDADHRDVDPVLV